MVLVPRSALPFLLLGLQSYLTLEGLVHLIDSSQPTFAQFLKDFKNDLHDYASFLQSQYKLAVNGIVKTDIPSDQDVRTFLYFVTVVVDGAPFGDSGVFAGFSVDTLKWGLSPFYPGIPGSNTSWPYKGYAWNGVYGAVVYVVSAIWHLPAFASRPDSLQLTIGFN